MRDHAVLMSELIPNAAPAVEIPDAGHASNIDNPAFLTNAVREFLVEIVSEP